MLNETTLSSTKWIDKSQLDALLLEDIKDDQVKIFELFVFVIDARVKLSSIYTDASTEIC